MLTPDRQLARLSELLERLELEWSLKHTDHAEKVTVQARVVWKSVNRYWATHDEDNTCAMKERFLHLSEVLARVEQRLGPLAPN